MYIWVMLSLFLATLYGYNLHFRDDARDLVHTPMAQAVTAKVVIQQNALKKYTSFNGEVIKTQASTEINLKETDLNKHTPYGFNFDNQQIFSYLFCTDALDTNIAVSCDTPDNKNFAITFMQIPPKWLNKNTKKPSTELNAAIKDVSKTDTGFGYNIINSKEIENFTSTNVFIPQPIYDNTTFNNQCNESNIPCLLQINEVEVTTGEEP